MSKVKKEQIFREGTKFTKTQKYATYCNLAFILSLQETAVQSLIDNQRNNSFTFLFAAYYYALQIYVKNNKLDLSRDADLYHIQPKELLVYVFTWIGRTEAIAKGETFELLLSNMNKLQDLVQAKMLKGLDKGVLCSQSNFHCF